MSDKTALCFMEILGEETSYVVYICGNKFGDPLPGKEDARFEDQDDAIEHMLHMRKVVKGELE